MPLYQILKRTTDRPMPISDDDSVLIVEKFNWWAAIFTPIWTLSHNMWVETIIWVAAIIGLSALTAFIGSEAATWLYIIMALWIGFEAPSIRASSLKRRGFNPEGDLVARDDDEAETAWVRHRLKS